MSLHVKPKLSVLPPSQRRFWQEAMPAIPRDNVLYGGTAVALRYGHRQSIDFDFFSAIPLDADRKSTILGQLNATARLEVLREAPNSVTAIWGIGDNAVKVSLFGGIRHGQVAPPDHAVGGPLIASPLDLLATKLKVINQRIEPKDYIDVDCLLRQGLQLTAGLGAARALYGDNFNPLDTAKAVSWFKEGSLDSMLPADVKQRLTKAVANAEPLSIRTMAIHGQIGRLEGQPIRKPERSPAAQRCDRER